MKNPITTTVLPFSERLPSVRYIIALQLFLCIGSIMPSFSHAGISDIQIHPNSVVQGAIVRVNVACQEDVLKVFYEWDDIKAKLFSDAPGRYSGFVPIAMNHQPGSSQLKITAITTTSQTFTRLCTVTVLEQDFPVQHLTVSPSKATLSPSDLKRHNGERKQVLNMFKNSDSGRLWKDPFTLPVEGRISTPFGVKRFINNEPRNRHSGVDIAAPAGTPVRASAAGRVTLTGEHFFAGKSVYIDHGNELFSMYFHMNSTVVHGGQLVTCGEIIGEVGSTGRATGPHLHWGVRMHGIPVDPFSLLVLFAK